MKSRSKDRGSRSRPEIAPTAFEWLFQHTLDPLLLTRPDGAILRANEAATRMLGMSEAELCVVGRKAIVADDEATHMVFRKRMETGKARGELVMRRGDGSEFLAEVTTFLLPDCAEPLSYIMFRDLTERERASRILRESQQRYAAIHDKMPVSISLSKLPEGTIVSANSAFLSLFEFELDEVLGKTSIELGVANAADRAKIADEFYRRGFVRDVEVLRQTRSGEPRALSLSLEPVSIAGEPHVLTIAIDITARVAAERALRASEERLSLFLHQAPTSIAIFDCEMHYLAHSRRFLADFDLPDASLVGRSHYDVFPDIDEDIKAVHRRCIAGASERSDETPFTLANGAGELYRWEMVPWLDARGAIGGVAFFSERITELKNAQKRIANQERLLADVIDGSSAIISAFDYDGRIMFANTAAARFMNTTKEALVGTFVRDHLGEDQPHTFTVRHVEVMATGQPQIVETTLPSQGTERTVLAAHHPLRDTAGVTYGTASVMTDITKQKQVEADLRRSEERTRDALAALEQALEVTRRTEEKFRHVQKMEAIGRLAGGIAHDFNNLLTVILGNSSEVLVGLRPGEPLHEIMGEIEKAGQRAAGLTRQLLAFSRKQVLEPRIVNVNELIISAEKMLRRIVGEDVEVTLLLDHRPQLCRLDKGQFEQVLLNLVVNARDAMIDGGRLTIETATVALDASYVDEHPEAILGEHVRVTVSDTGVGMPKELQTHIFEPFFTTKGIGLGTGLGLSTVYGIVKQSSGSIWLYSEPGQGTTFKIYFPAQSNGIVDIVPAAPIVTTTRGKETVLIVEDDEPVRTTVAGILRRAGYHVISAANGGEALLICEHHGGTIQILLTDVVMPRLNGRKLAERLRQVRPGMRVLFMSGYTENVVVHHGILDANLDFIAKPITSDALLTKVREVLDR